DLRRLKGGLLNRAWRNSVSQGLSLTGIQVSSKKIAISMDISSLARRVFIGSLLFSLLFSCSKKMAPYEPVVIDERDQEKSVSKSIAIDKVWAGHPVGFALLTHNHRQYIAYYNAERRMV